MKFKIGQIVSGIDIEVSFDTIEEFAEATYALRKLYHLIEMDEIKHKSNSFWMISNTRRIVSDIISDSGEKVAISLLASWPNPKSNSDIMSDTGLASATVYDQLTGRRGDKATWFEQDGELYRLSDKGENEVKELVNSLATVICENQ
jgi:hypothetical protein